MKNYTVYFDCFGRKLKMKVKANDENHAKEIVKNKIKFDNIVENEYDMFDYMRDIVEGRAK